VKHEHRDHLRILFLTADRFPPFRPAAKALFGDELPRRGHIIDWLTQADERSAAETGVVPFRGGTAYVAPHNGGQSRVQRAKRYLQSFANDFRIFGLLRRRRYSLVQVKDKYFGALVAIVAARWRGVPVYYWLAFPHAEALLFAAQHGIARYAWLNVIRGQLQKWALYRIILPASHHVFVQSEQMRRDIAAKGIPLEKMTAVPSSLKLSEFDAARMRRLPAKPEGERWIVYLGTLVRERRLDVLVRAMRPVLDRVPSARLLLVGSGEMDEDEAFLRSEAERSGVGAAITITGWLPMSDAWGYARVADVCVSPFRPLPIFDAASPTKLVEYWALAKPVVANHHPEQTLAVQQSGGGVLCKWDAHDFAQAILAVLDRPIEAIAMGLAGRRFVEEQRTHSRMASLVEDVYRQGLTDAGDRKLSVRLEVPE
jgi:glycosyltransferase involved in cell wall biosynthesis